MQGPEPSSEELVVRGVVDRVTFRNPQNGYAVFRLRISDELTPITVVGTPPAFTPGAHLIIRGRYLEHPKFGRQLSASSITETAPSTPEDIERYLTSAGIKGVGEKTVQRIVEEFGTDTIEVLMRDPDRVARVPGVGKKRAELLHETFKGKAEDREVQRFLLEHKIPRGLADRIQKQYGKSTVETISRDPYLLARDMRGVGFATADSIALNLGLRSDSRQRIKAGIYHALERAADDGHCFLPAQQLAENARSLLGIESDVDLNESLEELLNENYLVREDDRIALRQLQRAEESVAAFIADRSIPLKDPTIDDATVEATIEQVAQELQISFSPEQQEAVRAAARHRLLIITGGPGCGKTTIIRAVSTLFTRAGKSLALAAPTGRAAQRMSQVCNRPASTIHRLLRFDPSNGRFIHGPNEPLPFDALIIDETSMIDIVLARDLFSAIPWNATLILVGDRDQLPSVGPGRVLSDLVSLHELKTISLSRLFRRSEESDITSVAHLINSGITPTIPEPGEAKTDAYFISRSNPAEAAATVEKLVADQLPRKFGFEPNDICVLTPSNRGPLGAITLNQRLQNRINPVIDPEQEVEIGEHIFRTGDRVCQRVNNYQIDRNGVYNGDLGTIHSIERRTRTLVVEMWDGRLITYRDTDISQLSLAYAITVHRSQGSEIPCVVLALHDAHYTLLERQLIYTAVTRAKKLLVIVGSRRALHLATQRTNASRRLTSLHQRIRRLCSSGALF